MKDVVTFREWGASGTFTVEKSVLRQAMRDLRPLMRKDEQGFVEHAIRTGLPNPVSLNATATEAVRELIEDQRAA